MASRPPSPKPALPVIGAGLRDAFRAGYALGDLRKDALAGLTIGIVALPWRMPAADGAPLGLSFNLFKVLLGPAITIANRLGGAGRPDAQGFPPEVAIDDINGPLLFAAAEKAVSSLHVVDPGVRVIVLDMSDVPSKDGTAVVAAQGLVDEMQRQGVALVFAGLQARMVLKLRRAGVRRVAG